MMYYFYTRDALKTYVGQNDVLLQEDLDRWDYTHVPVPSEYIYDVISNPLSPIPTYEPYWTGTEWAKRDL